MSINKILKISIMILFAFVFTDIALSCPINPPVITSPSEYDIFIAGKTYSDLCQATGDPVISWSGSGTFDPTTGSPVSWTAPGTTGYVTITATNSSGSDQVQIKTTNIIYVDITATGDDDGTSWTDAFDTINEAVSASVAGNEIWVADGTYTLSSQLYVNKAISIYGGFEGDETSRGQRDWETNDTIVDGGNSRRCFYVSDDATIDGFTIQNGFTYGDGAGMAVYYSSPTVANCIFQSNKADSGDADGGGMHNWRSSPTVTNCVFKNNIAGDDGGGLANKSGSSGSFTNCVFSNNSTEGDNDGKSDGGGVFNTSSETSPVCSSPTFTDCVFSGNSTTRDGGGACDADQPGTSGDPTPSYTNCIFCSNSASDDGGGISVKDGADTTLTNCVFVGNSSSGDGGGAQNSKSSTNPSYTNCTFYSNSSSDDGGGIAVKDGSSTTVTNCILWNDSASDNGDEIFVKDSTISVTYSDVEGGYSGTENINSDPDFVDSSDLDGPDNELFTDDDGLRLIGWRTSFSPCIDSGNNSSAGSSDIIGNNRIVDGDGDSTAIVDMGAYEFANTDTDSDGMPDWWEVTYGLDPTDSTGSDGADGDGDSDNWRNIVEYLLRTEPDNGSSDGVDRMPAGWSNMEIEAKWTMSQSTFDTLQTDFWDGSTYSATGTTYDINWKWGGAQKLYWDFYYDNSSEVLSNDLHCLRKRRRLSSPYNDPADRDYMRVQYKSDPYRFGATWLRQEYDDLNLNDADANDIVEGDSTTWDTNPQYYNTVDEVLSDHSSFDESTLDDFLEIVDYRYKIDFEIGGGDQYTMSLDDVTSTYSGGNPDHYYELEMEIISMPHTAADVEELFRFLVELEADYSLSISTTSKGGIGVPESF